MRSTIRFIQWAERLKCSEVSMARVSSPERFSTSMRSITIFESISSETWRSLMRSSGRVNTFPSIFSLWNVSTVTEPSLLNTRFMPRSNSQHGSSRRESGFVVSGSSQRTVFAS